MTDVKRLLEQATPRPWATTIDGGIITVAPTAERDRREIELNADMDLIVYAVNRLPDYEAAVDALDRIVQYQDEELPDGAEAMAAWVDKWYPLLGQAREVLRRLREQVPA